MSQAASTHSWIRAKISGYEPEEASLPMRLLGGRHSPAAAVLERALQGPTALEKQQI